MDRFTRTKDEDDFFTQHNYHHQKADNARRESIRAHFVIHIEELANNVVVLTPEDDLRKYAQILKDCKKSEQQIALEDTKIKAKILENFCLLDSNFARIEDFEGITEEEMKLAIKLDKAAAENVCFFFTLDRSDIGTLDGENQAAFIALHWHLFNGAMDVIRPYLEDCDESLFDWVQSTKQSLSFHYENTPQAKAFESFLKTKRAELRTVYGAEDSWLKWHKNWEETPKVILEWIGRCLFFECESIPKDTTKKLPEVYKEIAKLYGITYLRRTVKAKQEILERYQERVKSGKPLKRIEKDFANTLGGRIIFTKRKMIPKVVAETIDKT